MKQQPFILDISQEAVQQFTKSLNLPSYVAKQCLHWIYKKQVLDLDRMVNISKGNREKLVKAFSFQWFKSYEKMVADDKQAVKFRYELLDKAVIESVALQEKEGYTLCISSQAGCALKCKFCATGKMGFTRDLTVGEILAQVLFANSQGYAINRIVMMGMGEPFMNLDAVLGAVAIITGDDGFGLSKRKVTISTAGVLAGIQRLIDEEIVLNLALSVGSPDPERRLLLMPVEKKNPFMQVVRKLAQYQKQHNRRLTLEYTVIKGTNDRVSDIQELINMAKYLRSSINLIYLNPYPGLDLEPVSSEKMREIKQTIVAAGIDVAIRFKKGQSIAAGCGQLAVDIKTKR